MTFHMKAVSRAALYCDAVYYEGGSFESVDGILKCEQRITFLWCCLLRCKRWFLLLRLWMKFKV